METGEAEQCRAHLPKPSRQRVTLNGYPGEIRQLAIADLGHEEPTLLLTNQEPVAPLRYARRIENAEAIEFMDALSAAVPMKIDVDLQLTLDGWHSLPIVCHAYRQRTRKNEGRHLVPQLHRRCRANRNHRHNPGANWTAS